MLACGVATLPIGGRCDVMPWRCGGLALGICQPRQHTLAAAFGGARKTVSEADPGVCDRA
eukprot:203438-Chlamydomonas_euryale.AAC.4